MKKSLFLILLMLVLVFAGFFIWRSVREPSEEAVGPAVPDEWSGGSNTSLRLIFYYPPEFGKFIEKRVLSSSTPDVMGRVEGKAVYLLHDGGDFLIQGETEDFCHYYSDQLYDDSVCRKADGSIPQECIEHKSIEICKRQTFKDSYEFIARKRFEHNGYLITFSYRLLECRDNDCPKAEDVARGEQQKIEEFIIVSGNIEKI